tara:strand:+ start:1461 stop:3326 length:1866 start_codon:yes stop_codon:yes gene_type:complete
MKNSIKKIDFVSASMRLFKSVLESNDTDNNSEATYLDKYGIIIVGNAIHYEKEIRKYLKTSKVSGSKLNHTFYSSANVAESKAFQERLADQFKHYHTTYGLRSLGIETDFMYVPHNWKELNLPERVKFDVVTGVSVDVLIDSCLKLFASGVAMKQETIEDVITVLDGCDYSYTGNEQIANKEARMFIFDKTNTTPTDAEDLFRFIVFKATGKTSIVKDKATFEALKRSNYALPNLTDNQIKELSKSFNRRKEYWLSLKSANHLNSYTVNKISRYSKKYHEPLEQDILNNLTQLIANKSISKKKLKESLKNVSIFRVIRALNGLGIQCANAPYSLYNIRNGKYYVKPSGHSKISEFKKTSKVYSLLSDHILSKIDQSKKVYIPDGVEYALPTSEKQFVGEVPNFSTIEVESGDRDLLIGVYWKNNNFSYVDYDLSAQAIGGGKVGWNSRWKDNGLTYSGDVTDAPKGAAEWMVVKDGLDESYQIVNNLYGASGEEFPEFTIMVGYGFNTNNKSSRSLYKNYFIDPDDLLFSAKVTPTKKQTTIGVVEPIGDKIKFTLMNSAASNKNVSTSEGNVSFINALLPRAKSTLKLNDFLNTCSDPNEADVDLSPSKITKTTLLDLLS